MPVFTLVDQEGRLFKPLAYTKNLAMAIAAILAITLDPAMRMMFTRMDFVHFRPRWLSWIVNQVTVGRYYPEEKHPVSKILFRVYEPACRFVVVLLLQCKYYPPWSRYGNGKECLGGCVNAPASSTQKN